MFSHTVCPLDCDLKTITNKNALAILSS